jgi:hypothetical protein
LKNGYTVTGESACVDPANFDEEIGREVAFKDARNKLWPLLGFLLANQRASMPKAAVPYRPDVSGTGNPPDCMLRGTTTLDSAPTPRPL